MLAICAYYAGIMLNAFDTYYAGIIGSSLYTNISDLNINDFSWFRDVFISLFIIFRILHSLKSANP